MKMLSQPVDYLLVYYTGHGLSLPNGELMLLMGNTKKNYAEKGAEILSSNTNSADDGLISVGSLYNALAMTTVPFTLIVEACYPNKEMQNALNRVSMLLGTRDGSVLLYDGDQDLVTDEVSHLKKIIDKIHIRFPYRFEDNVLIFARNPGMTAEFERNPTNFYGYTIPPLAAKFLRYSQYAPSSQQGLSLADVLITNIDSKSGIGEISLSGTVSFSDLRELNDKLSDVFSGKKN